MQNNKQISILDLIRQERAMRKSAFVPSSGVGGQQAPNMPASSQTPPPPSPVQDSNIPAPAPMPAPAQDPNVPSSDIAMSAPEQQPSQRENDDVILMLEKMGDDLDRKQVKIDSLEQKLNEQSNRVSEMYGNIKMLLDIIEKGSASSAFRK